MSLDLSFHSVTGVELCKTFIDNGGSRTIVIRHKHWDGSAIDTEIVLYGATEALDTLPKSDDFIAHTDVSLKDDAA